MNRRETGKGKVKVKVKVIGATIRRQQRRQRQQRQQQQQQQQRQQQQLHRTLSVILSRAFAAEIGGRTGGADIRIQSDDDDDDNNNNNNNNNNDNIINAISNRNTAANTMSDAGPKEEAASSVVVFATRIHLGHATTPPAPDDLRRTVASFLAWAARCGARGAAIAVDPAPKIAGYDLVEAVGAARDAYYAEEGAADAPDDDDDDDGSGTSTGTRTLVCDIVPVTPWGRFVPALNALVGWAATTCGASRILFASAETTVEPESVQILLSHVDDDTLVAGCALPGHDYHEEQPVEEAGVPGVPVPVPLTGRTTPWNTCAVWNVPKLALVGFPLVAEGLHVQADGTPGPGGVEEASAIALLQRILPRGAAVAKLVRVPGVKWEVDWEDDKRREWHANKMKSKTERAARHLQTLGLEGTVLHV